MLLIVKISKPIEISVGICIYALHASFTSSGMAYNVLVAWQLFSVTSLVVALHCSAPPRVRLPVPLSFSPVLASHSIFLCERQSHRAFKQHQVLFLFPALSRAPTFQCLLSCLCYLHHCLSLSHCQLIASPCSTINALVVLFAL